GTERRRIEPADVFGLAGDAGDATAVDPVVADEPVLAGPVDEHVDAVLAAVAAPGTGDLHLVGSGPPGDYPSAARDLGDPAEQPVVHYLPGKVRGERRRQDA